MARVASWSFFHGEPNDECIDVGGGHSLLGQYVDMGASPPQLIETVYYTSDCTGSTYYDDTRLADGDTCYPAVGPEGTNTYCDDDTTCTVYKSTKVLCESLPTSTATLEFLEWSDSDDCTGDVVSTGRMIN